jgi:hypothetical protein
VATTEEIFRQFFLPLYPEDARADLARARTVDANPANNPSVLLHLDEAARIFVAQSPALFGRDIGLDFSDASVHRLSGELTPERRDAWVAAGNEQLFNVVVHGSAYVGGCVAASHGGVWRVRRPLWESLVALESRAGSSELAVFHWWLKALGDDTCSTTLADRYRAHVEIPCARPEDLPVIAPPDRPLPRISPSRAHARGAGHVRYDVLYKYIKAHLPELRDLGEHFPTAERFDEYRFKWLDAKLLGGGRMLLLHGQSEHGAVLFWLTAAGFEKSAFIPCDAFPDHVVRGTPDKGGGDKIAVIVSVGTKSVTHEMLWWGP